MARWNDLATWVGPTTARSAGAMTNPPRGLVLHIASGYYDGTISWQKRPSGADRTSSHFIVARDGRCAQMVDTADGSWAQKSGNNTWLSVELEGFAPDDGLHASHPGWETATVQQVEVCAKLLARAHRDYGVPLQLASSPSGRGLGHHSMGAESGVDWGHSACPGEAIKAQKSTILARAQQLAAGITNGDDVEQSEPISPANAEHNTVGDALNIATQVRTGLWSDDSKTGYGTPKPGSALGKLYLADAAHKQALDALAAKVDGIATGQVDQAAVNAAVAAALADPAVVGPLVKAINDDAARRLVQ